MSSLIDQMYYWNSLIDSIISNYGQFWAIPEDKRTIKENDSSIEGRDKLKYITSNLVSTYNELDEANKIKLAWMLPPYHRDKQKWIAKFYHNETT